MDERETPGEEERRSEEEHAYSPSSDSGRASNMSVSITTTNNFINVGQIVHVSGTNNTVVLSGNQVQLAQQNTHCTGAGNHAHSPPPQPASTADQTSSQHAHPPSTGARDTVRPLQPPSTTYAAGPPDKMELLSLTQKLVGCLGSNWKILAAPLSIPDYMLASIEHDERTLLLKVNKLLVSWVDSDVRNDRRRLAMLLGHVELEQHCRVALRTE